MTTVKNHIVLIFAVAYSLVLWLPDGLGWDLPDWLGSVLLVWAPGPLFALALLIRRSAGASLGRKAAFVLTSFALHFGMVNMVSDASYMVMSRWMLVAGFAGGALFITLYKYIIDPELPRAIIPVAGILGWLGASTVFFSNDQWFGIGQVMAWMGFVGLLFSFGEKPFEVAKGI